MKSIGTRPYLVLIDLLKEKRLILHVTQKDLADKLGADQTFVSKYETGERRLDVIELFSVCDALGLNFVDFVTELNRQILNDNRFK